MLTEAKDRVRLLAEKQYYDDQLVISTLKAAAEEADHNYAQLSERNDANALAASFLATSAEKTKSLVARIDEKWRYIVDGEQRQNADAQRQSVEAQMEVATLQAEIQELQSELFLAKATAPAPVPLACEPAIAKLTSASLSAARPFRPSDDVEDNNYILDQYLATLERPERSTVYSGLAPAGTSKVVKTTGARNSADDSA